MIRSNLDPSFITLFAAPTRSAVKHACCTPVTHSAKSSDGWSCGPALQSLDA